MSSWLALIPTVIQSILIFFKLKPKPGPDVAPIKPPSTIRPPAK